MTPRLIALSGEVRSGKDTVADYLTEAHGYHKTFFSAPLNRTLEILNPWVNTGKKFLWIFPIFQRYAYLNRKLGYTAAKEIPEVRRLLQAMGTDVGRNMIDSEVWVNMARKKLQTHLDAGHDVTITGVRYPNELQMVRDLGATCVWINRPGENTAGADMSHSSENSLSAADFDYVIENSSGYNTLYLNTDIMLAKTEMLSAAPDAYFPPYDH